MDELNLYALYEADKGTLSAPGRRHFLKQVQAHGQAYLPYMQRVGPGFATAASEVKRTLDITVLPAFLAVVGRVTGQRFEHAYCDVRLYPQGQELAPWREGRWAGARLAVLVSFVLSIPSDDSLDSMARASLLSMFEEDTWDPQVKKLGKRSDGDDWGVVLEHLRRGFEGNGRCGGLGVRQRGGPRGGRAEVG